MKSKGTNGKQSQLTPKQDTVLSVLLNGGSPEEAAQAAGVARSTVYRWKSTRDFMVALATVDSDELAHRLDTLSAVLQAGAVVLLEIVNNQKLGPSTRMRAIQIAGAQWESVFKLAEISERLDTLEEQLQRMGNQWT